MEQQRTVNGRGCERTANERIHRGMQWNAITQKWRLNDDTSINDAAVFVKKPDISTEVSAKPESEETVQQSEETNKTEV